MNKSGFVTSALLYGILSLFLVLMMGTLAIVSNRKLASDRLKESALIDVQKLKTDERCFDFDDNCNITGYDSGECGSVVFIDDKDIISCNLKGIRSGAFSGISNGHVYIRSDIEIEADAFAENENVRFYTIGFEVDNSFDNNIIWGATSSYINSY